MKYSIRSILKERKRVNVIDVGHHTGNFARQIPSLTGKSSTYIIGIDPIDYNTGACHKFIKAAISTETGEAKFNTYNKPGCNSLLDMNLHNLIRDRNQKGWYAPHDIFKTGEVKVDRITLKSILDETDFDIVDILKIDAQGSDLDVALSAGDWLEKTIFLQTESLKSTNEIEKMYEGQTTIDEDIKTLGDLGFELIYEHDRSSFSCPESDLIFVNKKYIK